jgi:hypothetical protein
VTIVAVRPQPRRRRIPETYGEAAALGPCPLHDAPCRPGRIPLYPGGDPLPYWAEKEAGWVSTVRVDNLPPTPEQLRLLAELGRACAPATRLEARQLILRALEGETDDRWWEAG